MHIQMLKSVQKERIPRVLGPKNIQENYLIQAFWKKIKDSTKDVLAKQEGANSNFHIYIFLDWHFFWIGIVYLRIKKDICFVHFIIVISNYTPIISRIQPMLVLVNLFHFQYGSLWCLNTEISPESKWMTFMDKVIFYFLLKFNVCLFEVKAGRESKGGVLVQDFKGLFQLKKSHRF